ncbi:MAG: M20 family metallo-hydrolase [Bacteroidaceae bacterium]|nr:M20 family metallo-hydrolase [Bacteroidaceae bacterium]
MGVVTAQEVIELLDKLIATPSHSREEGATADILEAFLRAKGIDVQRIHNNVWAKSLHFDEARPTLLLNSHHDTVKPSAAYTMDPYTPLHTDGKIYGLGSNDAGASLVSLATIFCNNYTAELSYNTVLALTAEEEVMGEKGMRAMLPELERVGIRIDMALVGEPTGMKAAVGERGLLVFDATARGVRGHAARDEGVNALYKAIADIERLRNYRFERRSELLGDINVTVTMISAGTQHNVVPDECKFVVDVRTTDAYTNEQTVELLQAAVECELIPRSTRVRASAIGEEHPLVKAAAAIGRERFVSPTTSDMALMPFPSLKMGVGESARSHTANEFVMENEIVEGIALYQRMIDELNVIMQ